MNNVSIVGISVLSAIFFGALITLAVVLRKRLRSTLKLMGQQCNGQSRQVLMVTCDENDGGYVNPDVDDHIYYDEKWTSKVVELMPHCLGILKTSQLLTEQVIQSVIAKVPSGEAAAGLVGTGHVIASHVDAVVKAMYPPLDLNVLETRCCTLVLSVSRLVVASRQFTSHSINPLLHDLYNHLKFMKSKGEDSGNVASSSSSTPASHHHPPTKKVMSIFKETRKDNDDDFDDALINLDDKPKVNDNANYNSNKIPVDGRNNRMLKKRPEVTSF